MPIINKLLDEINSVSNLRLKFAELVRIEHLIDNSGNSQFLVQMFIVRINEHATSKLILNVYRSKSGMININSIKLEKIHLKKEPAMQHLIIIFYLRIVYNNIKIQVKVAMYATT